MPSEYHFSVHVHLVLILREGIRFSNSLPLYSVRFSSLLVPLFGVKKSISTEYQQFNGMPCVGISTNSTRVKYRKARASNGGCAVSEGAPFENDANAKLDGIFPPIGTMARSSGLGMATGTGSTLSKLLEKNMMN